MQLHLEIPYGKSILLPVEGSEAFVHYLNKGVMVSQDWRKGNEFTVEPENLELKFVKPVFREPEPPKVEVPEVPAVSEAPATDSISEL